MGLPNSVGGCNISGSNRNGYGRFSILGLLDSNLQVTMVKITETIDAVQGSTAHEFPVPLPLAWSLPLAGALKVGASEAPVLAYAELPPDAMDEESLLLWQATLPKEERLRLNIKPNGCSKCRNIPGCTPSCFRMWARIAAKKSHR